jgi:hypothetical protein
VRQRRPPSDAAASFLRPTAGKQNGSIVSSLGIGSGVLKIPALDTALRLPIKVSSATSNFMIGVTAAASGVAYFARGDIDPAIAGPVALGSVIGAVLGARFLMAVSGEAAPPFRHRRPGGADAASCVSGPSDASHDMTSNRKGGVVWSGYWRQRQFGTWSVPASSSWVVSCPPPASPIATHRGRRDRPGRHCAFHPCAGAACSADGRRLCLRAPLPLRRHRITRAGSHRCGGGVRSAHGRRRARLEKRLTCMAAETLAILEV